ncbi:MAG TPA: Wzz/FepE/Etk N-terminal domain-containing protein, partial [Micromonosporaceae bacterium]|nr:Wzz/FepE/Etk N-terminal domain-containing protein [Micromonosporaceae bacterium]
MPSPNLVDLTEPDGPTLMSYLRWLRRRWWILLLAAFIGAGCGLLLTQVQPRSYIAKTSIVVRQVGADANPNAKVNLDTEAQVGRSLVVAERARGLMATGVPADELVKYVVITVPPNSQVLDIAFEAGTPREAQSGSHAFAQAYLDLRAATAARALE